MPARSSMESTLPLCVDLDGTLVLTDTFIELLVQLLKERPWLVFALPLWLLRGKVQFKQQVAARVTVAPATLPYHPQVLEYVRAAQAAGRELILATASPHAVAQAVADHLDLFTQVVSTKGLTNMSGAAKGQALVALFGERRFEYIGNARVDLAVWRQAARASVVTNSAALVEEVRATTEVAQVFLRPRSSWQEWFRLLRYYQWVKNSLVFIPLIAAHRITDGYLVQQSVLAFVAFCLASSSIYILNDAFDLVADRQHPRKRFRPLAAGIIPLQLALLLIPILVVASFLFALLLPISFMALLIVYLVLTATYSFYFKRLVVLDVILLALLYTIRIFAGAAAIGVAISTWLTAFALFFFLSLALVKRFAELKRLKSEAKIHATGRGYHVGDLSWLGQLGTASAYLSVLVLALYISSAEVLNLYTAPFVLWGLVPLLIYWLSRLWLLAHRGVSEEDPLIFAMRDRVSYAVLCLSLATVVLAT